MNTFFLTTLSLIRTILFDEIHVGLTALYVGSINKV